eukprot:scaffold425_cov365-Pavlova_lutheri.AAC.3
MAGDCPSTFCVRCCILSNCSPRLSSGSNLLWMNPGEVITMRSFDSVCASSFRDALRMYDKEGQHSAMLHYHGDGGMVLQSNFNKGGLRAMSWTGQMLLRQNWAQQVQRLAPLAGACFMNV